jgi:1-acyl-sn-glycerol-3-phosphate acyltransferase
LWFDGLMLRLQPNLLFVFSGWLEAGWLLFRLAPVVVWFWLKRDFSNLARGVAWAFMVKLRVSGLDHLSKTPCVLLPLHEGLFDAVALLHLPIKMRFAARSELLGWQWLGGLLRQIGVIEVNPEQPISSYRRLLRQMPSLLAAGESLVIFPQGSVCGLEIDFQQSAFRLARQFGLPIVPVVLTGSHRVWDHPFSPKVQFGQEVVVRILEPTFDPNPLALKRHMKRLALEASPRRYLPQRDGFWDDYRLEIDPDFEGVWSEMQAHRLSRKNKSQSCPI